MAGSRPLTALMVGLLSVPALALELDGSVEWEARLFRDQGTARGLPSVAGTINLFQEWGERRHRLVGEFFAREDRDDAARSHADAREFYYQQFAGDVEFRAGLRRVFWGVTESRHLVDIINQTDLVEDLDGEAKLGQPMMNVAWLGGPGTTELFLMPRQRKRTFPGPEGFPRFPFPIAADHAQFESQRGTRHLDYALRWSQQFRGMDLGVSLFHGTARDPRLLPCLGQGSGFPNTEDGPNCNLQDAIPEGPPLPAELIELLQRLGLLPSDEEIEAEVTQRVLASLVLVPAYDRLRQVGVDAVYAVGGWALRLEALLRHRQQRSTAAAVAGVEYTLPGFFNTGWDVGVLAEYLWDQRRDDLLTQRFDDDVFLGARVLFNDIAGSLILGGVIMERDGRNRLFSLEASRRIGADWRASLDLRVFSGIPEDNVTRFLADQDYMRLRMTRFF